MNTLLMILAVTLMLASLALFAARFLRKETLDLELMPPGLKAVCLTSMNGGILLAMGGYWIESLLWIGLIVLDCGCIVYFLYAKQNHGRR